MTDSQDKIHPRRIYLIVAGSCIILIVQARENLYIYIYIHILIYNKIFLICFSIAIAKDKNVTYQRESKRNLISLINALISAK